MLCQYYQSATDLDVNSWIRVNIIFLDKDITPRVVSSCSQLDQMSYKILTQSPNHYLGGNWVFQGVKKTDPEYASYEAGARSFLEKSWSLYEAHAAACE